MAFLTTCPACGNPHVCSLAADAHLQLKCRRCRSVYPAARLGLIPAFDPAPFTEADTLAEGELEAAGAGPSTLVVVRHLPSRYPKRRKRLRRRRRQAPPIEAVAAALLAPPAPVGQVEPASAPPEPVADPQAPVPLPQPAPKPPVRKRARPTEEEESEERLLDLTPAAILTVFLVAAALLGAAVAPGSGLVRPLALAGLAAGLYATGSAFWHCRRLTVPGWATGLAAVTLLVSFVAPGLLGPGYRTAQTPPPPAGVQVVPHLFFAGDPAVRQSKWVDAGKASLRQGNVRVEVAHVWIGPPPKDRGARADPPTGERFLGIRLRVHRDGFDMPGAGSKSPSAGSESSLALSDASGRPLPLQPGSDRADGDAAPAPPGFGNVTNLLFLFAVSPAHPRFLRLELAGPAWGGPAPLRFQIPGPMIGYAPPRS